eukprot:7137000-Heterocapsa_arctica.AAC.1
MNGISCRSIAHRMELIYKLMPLSDDGKDDRLHKTTKAAMTKCGCCYYRTTVPHVLPSSR